MDVHIPVLAEETIEHLRLKNGDLAVDCTVGCGGHALLILEKITPGGRLIGIDQDDESLKIAEQRLAQYRDAIKLVRDNFLNLDSILKDEVVDGMLFDVGVSSLHFNTPLRGFSLRRDGPLDMRMDRRSSLTARAIVNKFPHREIERIVREYGEEAKAGKIASAIVEARRKKSIETTLELARLIERIYRGKRHYFRIHPATRTFQALRIAVNNELDALREGLKAGIAHLKSGARIAVISFHSMEDRIAKTTLKEHKEQGRIRILTKSPIRPSRPEVLRNPRARSAKLRVAERI